MKKRFDILILEEALEFLQNLDPKHYKRFCITSVNLKT